MKLQVLFDSEKNQYMLTIDETQLILENCDCGSIEASCNEINEVRYVTIECVNNCSHIGLRLSHEDFEIPLYDFFPICDEIAENINKAILAAKPATFGLIKSFDIDHGQLDGLSPQEIFVLGYELSQIDHLLETTETFEKTVHSANLDRIKKSCESAGKTCRATWLDGDKSEQWVSIKVTNQ